MSEERFNRLETKLDGVAADVARLKTGVAGLETRVAGLEVKQTTMEERLVGKMLMLHEDLVTRLATISEAQRDVPRQFEQVNRRLDGLTADVTLLKDSKAFFARVLDNHEHRITTLETPPPR